MSKEQLQRLVAPLRKFTLAVRVDGYVEGTIRDWPAHVSDPVYRALERAEEEAGVKLDIIMSGCNYDADDHFFFLHAEALENRDAGIRLTNGDLFRWQDAT